MICDRYIPSKQYARKRASRTHTYSATPSCVIIHAQAHALVRHPCVFYPYDDNNNDNNNNNNDNNLMIMIMIITGRTRFGSIRFGSGLFEN